MQPAIQFKNISKNYGEKIILDDVSLQISPRSFTGLIGGNGAGKTTLIKCMLDFCDLQSGQIEIAGIDHRNTLARSDLAFLPEKFTPPYFTTGKDFLQLMSQMHGQKFNPSVLEKIAKKLDITPSDFDQPVRDLSKGMSQKLGLASVLLSDKTLLVLDEPMSGLDPKARVFLKKSLLELKQQGKTLFFSTHLLADVETLCDQIVILHQQKIVFAGSLELCCETFNATRLEQAYMNCISR